jgi:sigma-B regulation protein RsbU (phosphoserine phosphatase)
MPRRRSKIRPLTSYHTWSTQQPPADSSSAGATQSSEVDLLLQERLDLHAQLFEAAQIQRKLSGPRMLQQGDLQFASEVFAARYLPGDFTVLAREGERVFATLGDIAGKGFAAGMWFTNLAGLLKSYGRSESDLGKTASEINRHLCYLRPVAPFVTAFIAQVDCESGLLTYCNAGHFPPIVLRADGRTQLLAKGGPLLGAIEDARFEADEITIEPGDMVVLYSDGVLECSSAAGEEFGSSRLLAAVQHAKQMTAHGSLMSLLGAVQDFAAGNPLCDDVSMVVIQRDAIR